MEPPPASAMPGVKRVILGRDVPQNLNTLLSLLDFGIDDEPLLSTQKVAYRGEPVAAVIAATEAQAWPYGRGRVVGETFSVCGARRTLSDVDALRRDWCAFLS